MSAKALDTASLLLNVNMQLMKRLAAHMRQSNRLLEPVHAGMLVRIAEEPCTISELARHQCVQMPTVSRSVNVLVERGLVERSRSDDDRRKSVLHLTDHGRTVLHDMMKNAHAHTESLLHALSETDRRRVGTALQLLLDRVFAAPAPFGLPQSAGGAGQGAGR